MPRSLCLRYDCIDKVRVAVTRSGYANQRALADDTGLSLATVSNFLQQFEIKRGTKMVNFKDVKKRK